MASRSEHKGKLDEEAEKTTKLMKPNVSVDTGTLDTNLTPPKNDERAGLLLRAGESAC